jgi:hypothetical protein
MENPLTGKNLRLEDPGLRIILRWIFRRGYGNLEVTGAPDVLRVNGYVYE